MMDEETKRMFDELFQRDPDYHVLICKPHGPALVPNRNATLNHIRQYHARQEEIKNLTAYLDLIGPLSLADNVRMPPPGGPPIRCLKTNSKAVECNECKTAFGSIKVVQKHL